MVEIKLPVSERLAEQLQPVSSRLPEILERARHEWQAREQHASTEHLGHVLEQHHLLAEPERSALERYAVKEGSPRLSLMEIDGTPASEMIIEVRAKR